MKSNKISFDILVGVQTFKIIKILKSKKLKFVENVHYNTGHVSIKQAYHIFTHISIVISVLHMYKYL